MNNSNVIEAFTVDESRNKKEAIKMIKRRALIAAGTIAATVVVTLVAMKIEDNIPAAD